MQSLLDFLRPAPKRETAELKVSVSGNLAEISLGKRSFFIRSDAATPIKHDVYDFALFGALALSISHNVEIKADLPISRAAIDSAEKLKTIMNMWLPRKTYPAPLSFSNIVESEPSSLDRPGLMCLSGGVDSTFAALEAQDDTKLTHALLIAGADYPNAQAPGFKSLKPRVQAIAQKTGLRLITVETSIRKLGFNWEMLHALNLAMCLNYHSGHFGWGAFAADSSPAMEFAAFPWGNNRVIHSALSSANFPVRHLGHDFSRAAKVRKIIGHPSDVVSDLSFCYQEQSHGGNCGVCMKCIRTRLCILTSGRELPGLFVQNDKLETIMGNRKPPPNQASKRNDLAVMWELHSELADGPVKDAVDGYIKRLKSRTIPIGRR
ncbi:MAG: hypothetical protein HRU33_22920 [Rhodobacteraceae bacterium]|nr:hypothetical protein [Paracoccaceae bacterium]